MFDRNHLHVTAAPARDQHHHVTVTENRAPTDASVRLLKEMEDAALAKVLGTIRLEGCPVDCVLIAHEDVLLDNVQFLIRYRLGGEPITVRHTHRKANLKGLEWYRAVFTELREVLARDIAERLLAGPMTAAISKASF
jgi:hypothetical protein